MPQLEVSQVIDQVRHTLGNLPKGGLSVMRILNDAGEYLCSCYPWSWLKGKSVTLDFESGDDFVWLPADFAEIVGIDTTNTYVRGIQGTTMARLIELRTSATPRPTKTYTYAIAHVRRALKATGTITFSDVPSDDSTIILDDGVNPPVTFTMDVDGSGTGTVAVDLSASGITIYDVADAVQDAIQDQLEAGNLEIEAYANSGSAVVNLTSRIPGSQGNVTITDSGTTNATYTGMSGGTDGGYPRARLEIWPTPGADDPGALTLIYRAGWETLDEDSDFVSIPEWIQGLYIRLVRAFARGYEREDVASMNQRIMEIIAGPEFQAARRRDGQMQPEWGELRNSAAAMAQESIWTWIDNGPISDPS